MRESVVEMALVQSVKDSGGKAYKFVSPGQNGVPDRIVILPVPKQHRDIVHRYFKFVECKAPGKKPQPLQIKEHDYIRSIGHKIEVLDARL
jgi:hypothetical protein